MIRRLCLAATPVGRLGAKQTPGRMSSGTWSLTNDSLVRNAAHVAIAIILPAVLGVALEGALFLPCVANHALCRNDCSCSGRFGRSAHVIGPAAQASRMWLNVLAVKRRVSFARVFWRCAEVHSRPVSSVRLV